MFKAQLIRNFSNTEPAGDEFIFGFFNQVAVNVFLGTLTRQAFK